MSKNIQQNIYRAYHVKYEAAPLRSIRGSGAGTTTGLELMWYQLSALRRSASVTARRQSMSAGCAANRSSWHSVSYSGLSEVAS